MDMSLFICSGSREVVVGVAVVVVVVEVVGGIGSSHSRQK